MHIVPTQNAWDIVGRILTADTHSLASYAGIFDPVEGSVTFTGIDGQPIKYWLAIVEREHVETRYLTTDPDFGNFRPVESSGAPVTVGVGHWGSDSFTLKELSGGQQVFGPFSFRL